MHLAIKNLFQSDEIQVLIAGVARLLFDLCYSVNFCPSWLISVDAPPHLGIGPSKPFKHNNRAENLFKTLKGPTQVILQIRTCIP